MQTKDLFDTVFAAVAQDSALIAWASVAFTKSISFYRGLPSEVFPDMDSDTPFVVFGDPYSKRAAEKREIVFGFECWLGLSSGNYTDLALDDATAPAGSDLILEGAALLRAAVLAGLPAGCTIQEVVEYHDTMGSGDEVHGFLEFEIKQTLVIGQSPMT